MTTQLEQAARQALEALHNIVHDFPAFTKDKMLAGRAAYTALHTALEQPAQDNPVALPKELYEFVLKPEPLAWHHPACEGECIACLIEQAVQESYGSQGLMYLRRHLADRKDEAKIKESNT